MKKKKYSKQEGRQEAPKKKQDWKKIQEQKKKQILQEEVSLAYLPVPGPEAGPVRVMGTVAGSCSALETSTPGSSSGLSGGSLTLIGKEKGLQGISFRGNCEFSANGSLHAMRTCQTSAAYNSVRAVPPELNCKGGGKTTGSKSVQALKTKPNITASISRGIQATDISFPGGIICPHAHD